ncbi:MFS transporter [Jatrophihabitans endophyticus]|uniref:MFS transporter n=1 Tax=Jatrophihabitans endophyticus TaxID=1206085 RepID=UPI0019DBC626|nr:MFS transporter [Jatrophihabitans endophyticus]MBE7188299.1 MFS transporter [Jatrophihabitans endophyticus]
MAATSTPDAVRVRRGWYLYGWASHTFPTVVVTVFMSRYLTSLAENAVGTHGRVHVLGVPIAPGSLFAYTVTASTILLVVLMPLVGAIADRTRRKRDIMLGCGLVGALACVAMVVLTGTDWPLGAALFVVAYLGYSTSIVVSYSLLVDLSASTERDHVSSVGWAISYLGGGLLLGLDFVLSLAVDKATLARIALCTAGVWWIAFSVPVRRRLPAVIGTPDPLGRARSALAAGFVQLAATIRHARGFPLTLAFLAAFLVYNDGIQTVTTVAAQYGDKELKLSDTVLLLGILLVQFVAYVGAIALGRLARVFGAKRVVLGSLVVWLGAVGIAYELQVKVAWQFFALAVLIAIVLGGAQALSRSIFSRLIPAGSEAAYFGFYEISDAGTSWLGPLVFGLAYQNTGNYRSALASLVVFFVVGFVLLALVPLRRAIAAAGNPVPDKV